MAETMRHELAQMSILEAVEALETIAELEFEREVDLATEAEINKQNKQVTLRAVKWVGREDPDETAKLIKETFHVVLNYLKDSYSIETRQKEESTQIEGMKTIMVLVGEAAQKLDKYTTVFKHTKAKSVKGLKEYRQLQEFYLTRIARKIDEGILSKWILELTKTALQRRKEEAEPEKEKPLLSKYAFIDLESVKKDTEYELFYLRKEDGTRFFNPRLVRNIKLVCDFGETIKRDTSTDPLEGLNVWHDHALHVSSKEIIGSLGGLLDRYFRETKRSLKKGLVSELNKAIMALFLASNPRNLLSNVPVKACSEYFTDFHVFLRRALKSREYHRMIVYPPKKTAKQALTILDMAHRLCGALFTAVRGMNALLPALKHLFNEAQSAQSPEHEKAAKESSMLWSSLAGSYAAMKKITKRHPNGPLKKLLTDLDQGMFKMFDPFAQNNIPYQFYSLYLKGHRISVIRIPSPTTQEFIHKADIIEEFNGFLRSYKKGQLKRTHLLFNLQDRTSWKAHSRCVALEELQETRQFAKTLSVVTLTKETEFYHQIAPYHRDHQAEIFIAHFKEHLADENCGFYFPKRLKTELFKHFVDEAIRAIHKIFFGNMNVLTVSNRRDFIEIFYLLLQLKILDLEHPDSISFTCKDGIDDSALASAQLYAFLNIINQENVGEKEINELNFILYAPPLLLRERTLLHEKVQRMVSAIKRVENARKEMGTKLFNEMIVSKLGKLFKRRVLHALTLVPTL